jgi:LCP family protein required for cell wall assembly
MIELLKETFARHEDLAPAPGEVRRRIDVAATRQRRTRRGVVAGTAVALVALAATVFVRLDAVRTPPEVGSSAEASVVASPFQGPMTFLIVGTDKRPNIDDSDLRRADTIMLAHLPADRSGAYLISLPRDEMVSFEGERDKLNGVFARYGARGLRDAVQNLTGIRITGAVEVDFAGLIGVTDAVGGIDLCVPRRAQSEHTGKIFEPGCRRFSGAEAMDYLRQRRSFENGDFDRQMHGREYVKALYKRLGDASLTEILNVIEAGGKAVRVDAGGFQLAGIFAAARDVKPDQVLTIAPPAEFDGPDTKFKPEAARLWKAVRDGTLPDWVMANPKQVDQR